LFRFLQQSIRAFTILILDDGQRGLQYDFREAQLSIGFPSFPSAVNVSPKNSIFDSCAMAWNVAR